MGYILDIYQFRISLVASMNLYIVETHNLHELINLCIDILIADILPLANIIHDFGRFINGHNARDLGQKFCAARFNRVGPS